MAAPEVAAVREQQAARSAECGPRSSAATMRHNAIDRQPSAATSAEVLSSSASGLSMPAALKPAAAGRRSGRRRARGGVEHMTRCPARPSRHASITAEQAGTGNADRQRAPRSGLGADRDVELAARRLELGRLFGHAASRLAFGDALGRRVVAHLLRDLHRAELRPAHGAEVRAPSRLPAGNVSSWKARAVSGSRPRLNWSSQRNSKRAFESALSRAWAPGCALGEVGGVRRDLVGDDALLDVVAVGQPEVLLRRHVAQHRGAEPADHRGADGAGDVVVAGRDVGRQRPERVERRFVAVLAAARPCWPGSGASARGPGLRSWSARRASTRSA